MADNALTFARGTLFRGMSLALNHPAHSGRRAVWIGEFFIATDFANQPSYRDRTGAVAIIDSVDVAIKERDGKKPLTLLTAGTDSSPLFLHVHTDMETKGKLKEDFWRGTIHQCDTIALNRPRYGGHEELIAFDRDGDSVDIFCDDGSVHRVQRVGTTLSLVALTHGEMARLRLSLVRNELDTISENAELTKDERFKRTGYWLHQLAAIGRVARKQFPELQEEIFELFLEQACRGMVSMAVHDHVREVMGYAPAFLVAFGRGVEIANARRVSGGTPVRFEGSANVVELKSHKTGKTNAERERLRAERAAEDRAVREAMRGKSGGKTELRTSPENAAKRARKHGQRKRG